MLFSKTKGFSNTKLKLAVSIFIILIVNISCNNRIDKKGSEQEKSAETIIKHVDSYKPDFTPPPQEINGYKLVFNDEFNHEGPMKSDFWRAEEGFRRNNEDQWYQSENGYCKDGRLIITAKREQKKNPDYVENSDDWKTNRKYSEYTSASFITRKPYHEKYDSIMMIMRAKLPLKTGGIEDYGIWPAFWTTGAGPWPHGGEIDIMEYYNGRLMANFAVKGERGAKWRGNKEEDADNSYLKNIISGKAIGFRKDKNWLKKYHTWKLIGNGKFLSVYLDDVFMSRIALNSENEDKKIRAYPFLGNTCNYWINLAVGGNPHPDKKQLAITSFPRQYEIDYARIYVYKNNK
jgi:hypothetical protein